MDEGDEATGSLSRKEAELRKNDAGHGSAGFL
jgi:hypothetical protein